MDDQQKNILKIKIEDKKLNHALLKIANSNFRNCTIYGSKFKKEDYF